MLVSLPLWWSSRGVWNTVPPYYIGPIFINRSRNSTGTMYIRPQKSVISMYSNGTFSMLNGIWFSLMTNLKLNNFDFFALQDFWAPTGEKVSFTIILWSTAGLLTSWSEQLVWTRRSKETEDTTSICFVFSLLVLLLGNQYFKELGYPFIYMLSIQIG